MSHEWVAVYQDGTILPQFQEGKENRYADIKRDQLYSFDIWEVSEGSKRAIFRLHFDSPDKKLIYRRRVHKHSDGTEHIVILVGWQIKHAQRNIQSLALIYPSGVIEVFDGWKPEVNMEKPVLHPSEGEDWE